jgi:hypothetical protein
MTSVQTFSTFNLEVEHEQRRSADSHSVVHFSEEMSTSEHHLARLCVFGNR